MKNITKKKILMLWLICLILIIYFSTAGSLWHFSSIRYIKKVIPYADKIAHFLAYMIMTSSICILIRRKKLEIWSVLFLCILGIITELIQFCFPNRTVSIFDAGSNVTGVILGYFVAKIIKKYYSRKNIPAE